MPELPEVETVRRDLARQVRGRSMSGAEVLNPGSLKGGGPEDLARLVKGRSFASFVRRGKYLIMMMDRGLSLVVHLKMTGVIQHQSPGDPLPKAARVIFYFRDGSRLVFSDQRKFGAIEITWNPHKLASIRKMGPEPLGKGFSADVLRERLAGRKGPIKPLLLDQTIIAGLGNIYASEALHRAGILPQRPANSLVSAEIGKLHRAIVRVLKEAIAARGSSVDTYRDGQGKKGWFQVKHRVYDRQGRKCRRCGGTIVRDTYRGRGTYWCPRCQR